MFSVRHLVQQFCNPIGIRSQHNLFFMCSKFFSSQPRQNSLQIIEYDQKQRANFESSIEDQYSQTRLSYKTPNGITKYMDVFRIHHPIMNALENNIIEIKVHKCRNDESAYITLRLDAYVKVNPELFYATMHLEIKLILSSSFIERKLEDHALSISIHNNKLFGQNDLLHTFLYDIMGYYWGSVFDEHRITKVMFQNYKVLLYKNNNQLKEICDTNQKSSKSLEYLEEDSQRKQQNDNLYQAAIKMLADNVPIEKVSEYTNIPITKLIELEQKYDDVSLLGGEGISSFVDTL